MPSLRKVKERAYQRDWNFHAAMAHVMRLDSLPKDVRVAPVPSIIHITESVCESPVT